MVAPFVAVVFFCCEAVTGAQSVASGSIIGAVRLDDGGPVGGARVVVVNARRSATTDGSGHFEIQNVAPGSYEVFAQREQLTAPRVRITVVSGETASVALALSSMAFHEEVTVTAAGGGTSTAFESFNSVRTLDSVELAQRRGATIAESLANEPGVSVRSFGAGNDRPIIRGFDGDRVLILQDGMRTGDLSSTSADHAVSIDPGDVERLEVVKGPATLMYGSNAIGGVVNAITSQGSLATLPFAGFFGTWTSDVGSGDAQAGATGNLQYGRGGWTVWLGAGGRRTEDYAAPSGTVQNSGTSRAHGKTGVGWTGRHGFGGVGIEFDKNTFKIPVIQEGVLVEDHGDRRSVRVDSGLHNLSKSPFKSLKFSLTTTHYQQGEVENTDGVVTLGTLFDNATTSLRGEFEQSEKGRLQGRLGIEGLSRTLRSTGQESLAPRTRQLSWSTFAYEEVGLGRARLQFGGRVESTTYRPDVRETDDALSIQGPQTSSRRFLGASGSAGAHVALSSTNALVATATVSSRAPALEELYNFGPDAGNGAFEVGDANLGVERSMGLEVGFRRRAQAVSFQANAYTYNISNFVFLNFTGVLADGMREAVYVQGDARFVGIEASMDVQIAAGVRARGGIGMVQAQVTTTGEPLPRIPPVAGKLALQLPWKRLVIEPEVVVTGAQRRIFRGETPTTGWVTVGMAASGTLVRRRVTHSVTLKAVNLTNREYRLHTSFLKDFAPEMGLAGRLTYTLKFF